jgi:hypothetical protein
MENANLKVDRARAKPTTPAHVPGVRSGNDPGRLYKGQGIRPVDGGALGSARRSTGINAKDREPIDPRMPRLSPA